MNGHFRLGKGDNWRGVGVCILSLFVVIGCGQMRSTEAEAELAKSTFYQDQLASGVVAGATSSTSGDGGFIPGGGNSGSDGDNGSIPDPNGDGSNGDSGSAGNDTSGNDDAGSGDTGGDVASGTTGGDSSGSTTGGSAGDTGGTTSGNDGGNVAGGTTTGGDTSGNDGGTIPGGDSGGTGNDGGNVAGGTTGGSASSGDTAGTTGGDTGGTTAGDVAGGTTGGTTGGDTGGSTSGGDTSGNDGGDVASGTTGGDTSGSDGGNVPGGDDGGTGGDTGNVGTPMDIEIGRVCSVMRSSWSHWVFFEEAEHPIITFESYKPVEAYSQDLASMSRRQQKTFLSQWFQSYTGNRNSMYAGFSYMGYPTTYKERMAIKTVDLYDVNLFDGPHNRRIQFDQEALKTLYPNSWQKVLVRVSVCDDLDGDGLCSDERKNPLSVREVTFLGKNVPTSLRLDVWAGRHFTRAGDPEMCEMQYSPLVLDLKGDGIRLSPAENGVIFDLNDDGYPVFTGWTAGQDDAFLIRDLNDNGEVDSGAELFGSATRLASGQRAANGFEALKDLDANRDNRMDPSDPHWHELRVWRDTNQDARVDWGEVSTLDEARVAAIDLDYVNIAEVDPYGNETRQRSVFWQRFWMRWEPRKIVDVWFRTLRRD